MSISSPSDPSVRASIEDIARDEKRLQALRRYDILDTEPEPAFDRIARLAAHLFDAPTALVNFVDADRQWFKSTVGIDAQETGLDVSFCVYTVEKGDVFVVEDLAEDERFEDNPYVTEDGIRFYAGAPLTTPDDRRLGTLCVLDTDPCSPSEETLDRLSDLAATVVDELELRRERIEHRQSRELLRHAQELAHVGGWEYTPRDDDLTWTDETYRIHGLSPDAEIDLESAVAFYAPEDRSVIRSHVETLLAEGEPYDLELDIETAEGHRRRIRTIGQAHRDDGQTTKITGAIQDITEQHRHRRLDEVQSTFFERIATGAPIHEVLDEITRFTEEELPGTAVSLLRLEDDRLYHASGSSLPDDFVEAIDGVEIGPEAGTCGAAAHRRQRTVTEDIQTDARWADYRDVAERAGLRSCSSEVIEGSDGTVLGTFALYRSAPGRPDPAERALLGRMAHVASVALERAARERALRRSEKTFRTVVENAQPVTFMIDRDGTFLLSEGSDLQALGLDPGEMVGASVYDVYANNHEVIDAVQRALGGAHVDEEVEVDGLIFDCWFSPFFDEDGTVAGVIGMAVDITDRRRAQLELRTQKEMLQTLFDNVPVMIALVDDGTIELVNEHFESVLGWSQDALESTPDLLARCYPDPHERRRMLDTIEQAPDEWRDFRPRGSEDRRVDTIWKYVVLSDGRRIGIGVDISERKARERELRENYQRLRLALEAADAGTFDHDLSTDRILWDERSLKLYGLDPDRPERDVSLLEDLLLEDDFDHLTTALDRAVDGDAPQFDTTFRVRRTDDGAVRHIRSYGIILRDEGGAADRVIGINQDVTERKEREKRLRLLEAAVEHSPLTVLITEADRLDAPGPKTVYANPTFTEVTGYCRDDIIGQSPRLLQGPDTDPAALDHIRDALEREEPVRQVVCNYKNDGTPYWNDLFIAPVRDEDGAVTHYVSLQQDVTDRIRRKEALERQNDLFAKAQDIANVGAWEYDRRSDEVVLTDEGYRIHGLAPDTGMTPARSIEFYHPDDRPKIRTAFTQALEDGTSYDLELRLIGADGEQRWVHTRGEPQMDDGEVVRIRGTIQDVTERVRQREALEQAKEAAEEADRIKSALLSNMNHEFRTPLTSIISFSELLSREPELAETFAERILGGGKRLLYTLNTVMDFAELEANTVAPTSDPVNVGALARATVHTFSHLVAQKELTVQIHEPDEGLTAPLDEQLLERIFAHLVHNAIKFTEEGTVDIAVRREGPRVCVSVSDSGVGIDPEFLPRAFDEFAQASSGYDRTHEGNGLGLTIVERLVERMDGDVSIDSTPGEGTTVTVRLPVLR